MANRWHIEITGWNQENESLSWDGYGSTEDEAIKDAMNKSGIIEIGDTTILEVGNGKA